MEKYCDVNLLTVNCTNLKIVIFQKGGERKHPYFQLGKENIEVVKDYKYLGMTFSNSGLYSKASENMTTEAKIATGNTLEMFARSKSDSWYAKDKLFDSVVIWACAISKKWKNSKQF